MVCCSIIMLLQIKGNTQLTSIPHFARQLRSTWATGKCEQTCQCDVYLNQTRVNENNNITDVIPLLLKSTACNYDNKVADSTASHADYSLMATTKFYFGKV